MGPHGSAPGAWTRPGLALSLPCFIVDASSESGSCRTQPTSIASISRRPALLSSRRGAHLLPEESLPARTVSWVCERGCRQPGQRCGEAGRGPRGAACWTPISRGLIKTEAKRVHVRACTCVCMCVTQGLGSGRERGGPARAEADSPSPPPFLPLGLGG